MPAEEALPTTSVNHRRAVEDLLGTHKYEFVPGECETCILALEVRQLKQEVADLKRAIIRAGPENCY